MPFLFLLLCPFYEDHVFFDYNMKTRWLTKGQLTKARNNGIHPKEECLDNLVGFLGFDILGFKKAILFPTDTARIINLKHQQYMVHLEAGSSQCKLAKYLYCHLP